MARYHIETYGCTSNRGESRQIEQALRDGGHHPADGPESADVAILNTCTVVEKTERNMLRRAEELDAETPADLVVTGCMALAQGEEFRNADIEADVLPLGRRPQHVLNGECPTVTPDTEPVIDGVVGILPIARGCMSDCSYCITKQATGRIEVAAGGGRTSRRPAHWSTPARREIRITGQDTGVYGWDRNQGESLLPELLDRICTEIDGDFRVRGDGQSQRESTASARNWPSCSRPTTNCTASCTRRSSLEATPCTADMRRQHEVGEYVEVVETFDDRLDYWTLSTDFIVGFPTEDDHDFQQTMALLRETRPEKINVTRFSKRPGTDAADMKGLGGTLKKERSKAMSELKMDVVAEAYEAMVESDEAREVLLVEGRHRRVAGGLRRGLSTGRHRRRRRARAGTGRVRRLRDNQPQHRLRLRRTGQLRRNAGRIGRAWADCAQSTGFSRAELRSVGRVQPGRTPLSWPGSRTGRSGRAARRTTAALVRSCRRRRRPAPGVQAVARTGASGVVSLVSPNSMTSSSARLTSWSRPASSTSASTRVAGTTSRKVCWSPATATANVSTTRSVIRSVASET